LSFDVFYFRLLLLRHFVGEPLNQHTTQHRKNSTGGNETLTRG
jgi:hypothetical protein